MIVAEIAFLMIFIASCEADVLKRPSADEWDIRFRHFPDLHIQAFRLCGSPVWSSGYLAYNVDQDRDNLIDAIEWDELDRVIASRDEHMAQNIEDLETLAATRGIILIQDTDGDGLADNDEMELNRYDYDSDDDGLSDGFETEWYSMYVVSPVICQTLQDNPDSDGDGLSDGLELGLTCEEDGLTPGILYRAPPHWEHIDKARSFDWLHQGSLIKRRTFQLDANPLDITSPSEADSDHDGLLDGVEDENGNGACDDSESNAAVGFIQNSNWKSCYGDLKYLRDIRPIILPIVDSYVCELIVQSEAEPEIKITNIKTANIGDGIVKPISIQKCKMGGLNIWIFRIVFPPQEETATVYCEAVVRGSGVAEGLRIRID